MVDRSKHPTDDELDAVFNALSDRSRRAMLRQLAEDELSVREIAAWYDMSMQAVSKHLGVLERAGLVVKTKDGRLRRCRMELAPLQAVRQLIQEYTVFWERQLDSLESFLGKPQRKEES